MTRKNSKKILNNSYTKGENLKGDEYEFGTKLIVDESLVSMYMKDTCGINDILYSDLECIVDGIMCSDDRVKTIVNSDVKVTRVDINYVFDVVYGKFSTDMKLVSSINISYLFDIMVGYLSISHDYMFSMLSYRNKEIVVSLLINDADNDITRNVKFMV